MESNAKLLSAKHWLFSASGSAAKVSEAIRLAEEAIEIDGNIDACLLLGGIFTEEPPVPGVTRDVPRALTFFEKAVAQGSEIARAKLGLLLLEGPDGPRNMPRAVDLFERVPESNPIFPAIRGIFAFLLTCQKPGVRQDESRAAQLFQKMIDESNSVPAMLFLAALLARPRGNIQYDGVRAIRLLEDVIEDVDSPDVLCILGTLLSKHANGEHDINRAISFLQTAAEQNEPGAKVSLAKVFFHNGDTAKVEQAIRLCEELIQQKSCIEAHVTLADFLSGRMNMKETLARDNSRDDNRARYLYYRTIVIALGNSAEKLQEVGLEQDHSYVPSTSGAIKRIISRAVSEHHHQRSKIDLAIYCVCGTFPVELEKAERLFMSATNDQKALNCIATRILCFLHKLKERINGEPKDSSLRAEITALFKRVCRRLEVFVHSPDVYGTVIRMQADILLNGEEVVDFETKRQAAQLYKTAAQCSNPEALLAIGDITQFGQYGERKSDMNAFLYFAKVLRLQLPEKKHHITCEAIVKMATIVVDCEQRRR